MPGTTLHRWLGGVLTMAMVFAACGPGEPAPESPVPAVAPVASTRATEPVATDADDPAIWVSASDPAASLIIATDKGEIDGGLYVYGLDGRTRQVIGPLDRPNNVDVEYGLPLGGTTTDIAVVTERRQHRLRVFGLPPDGGALVDLAPDGIPVLEGQTGEAAEPMGIGLYKRPSDGAVFAIVAPKTGGTADYLWQYRLEDEGQGQVTGTLVRRFGQFSGARPAPDDPSALEGEIEAVVVDDALGYVYYSDERFGIRKYHADPDHPDAARELATFGTEGYLGDREGLALYATGDDTGFIVSSDQVDDGSRLMIYPREGAAGRPHDHSLLTIVPTVADDTDGIDVVATPLPGFPRGLLVMMNSRDRNFLLYRWQDILPPDGTD